jgi:glutamine cyclotransferase
VNELEYINGYIYANQWQTNMILKINPADGKVLGYANLDDIRRRTGIPEKEPGNETAPEELNGIAYDAASNRIFITGKNWPKIIEIKLDN